MSGGERADLFLVAHGFAASRAEAQAAIRAGNVSANGKPVTKAAQNLQSDMKIEYAPSHPYVSRGGVKLDAALTYFGYSPSGLICLDVGASTGGFTQVLLERGAARVYAIDVGHGQLVRKIAANPNVVAIEGLNARDLSRAHVQEAVAAIVVDVSFISLKLVLPAAFALAAPGAWAVLLIKPQFETGREAIGKGGIVKTDSARQGAVDDISAFVEKHGWRAEASMPSPITGGDGNQEFLLAAQRR